MVCVTAVKVGRRYFLCCCPLHLELFQNVVGVFGKGCHNRKGSVGNMGEHRQSKKIKEGQIGQQSVSQIYMLLHICLVVVWIRLDQSSCK